MISILFDKFIVEVCESGYDGIIAVKMCHKISDYTILVFSVYSSPENSPWGRDANSSYAYLLSKIYLADDVNAIFVCGDVNGRIGDLTDTVLGLDNVSDGIPVDKVVNGHDSSLIEFLHEAVMSVVNSRVQKGHDDFTFVAKRGKSVVDYIIIPQDQIPMCKEFNVKSCTELAEHLGLMHLVGTNSRIPDHAILSLQFEIPVVLDRVKTAQGQGRNNSVDNSKYRVKHLPNAFMESAIFRQAILDIIQMIKRNQEEQNDIDAIYEQLCDTISGEMDNFFYIKSDNLLIE